MAVIYKLLKELKEQKDNNQIDDDKFFDEFISILQSAKKTGKEKRCALKFITDNISNESKQNGLRLVVELEIG